jgi:hypothetical protein
MGLHFRPQVNGVEIQGAYVGIQRMTPLVSGPDAVYDYYVTAEVNGVHHHVAFQHRYSDGWLTCLQRGLTALEAVVRYPPSGGL